MVPSACRLCALLLLSAAPRAGAQVASLPADSVAIGRRASALFLRGSVDSLLMLFAPRARENAELVSRLRDVVAAVRATGGREVEVVEERWMWRNGQRQYVRVSAFEGEAEPLAIRFVMAPDGLLLAWGVNTLSQMPAADPGPPAPGGSRAAGGAAAPMSPETFAAFGWILGRWQGRGIGALAGVAEFHEAYALLDDSTVVMRAYERPPFTTATDSTRFEYRGGHLRAVPARGNPRTVIRVAGDTVEWSGGVRYVRLSADLWRALFPPRANDAREMYYEMRRMPAGR